MKKYVLPVTVEIEADNPDRIMREIADIMYDAVEKHVNTSDFDAKCKRLDVSYSIYVKPDQKTFGKRVEED